MSTTSKTEFSHFSVVHFSLVFTAKSMWPVFVHLYKPYLCLEFYRTRFNVLWEFWNLSLKEIQENQK